MKERMTQRKKQALETKERIRSAAFELFNQYGYENVSMQDIASKAGCSAGNLYHYFPGKDSLVLQFTDHVDTIYESIAASMQDDVRPAMERLRDFMVRAIVESNREEVITMGFSHALQHPEQKTLAINDSRPYFRILSDLVRQCVMEGSIPESYTTEEIMRRLMIVQRGILFQWRIEQRSFDIEAMSRCLVNAILSDICRQ